MKKIKYLIIVIINIIVILIIGIYCNVKIQELEQTKIKNISEVKEKEKIYYGVYQCSNNFSELIDDNPIDKNYYLEFNKLQKSTEFSTTSCVELENKYIYLWKNEIDNSYNHLLSMLDYNDKEKLIDSQDNWIKYIKSKFDFVRNKFIYTGLIGTQGYVQLATLKHNMYKQRAIELLEYIYIIENRIEFVYKNNYCFILK